MIQNVGNKTVMKRLVMPESEMAGFFKLDMLSTYIKGA